MWLFWLKTNKFQILTTLWQEYKDFSLDIQTTYEFKYTNYDYTHTQHIHTEITTVYT
jgi:hypothetical protein